MAAVTGTLTEPAASASPEPAPPPMSDRPPAPERISPPMPDDRVWGWVGPLLVTAFAGVLRFWNLGQPRVFSFDEIREAHRVMEANEANGKMVVVH